jgi:phosphonatase-like hydrolase
MRTALVVFDIAGTTVVDKGNVADSFIAAFQQHGFDIPREAINEVMGYRKIEAIQQLLSRFYGSSVSNQALIDKIHTTFEETMLQFYMADKDLAPLPFTEETFHWLQNKGIKVALNTGFTRYITEGIMYKLSWKNNPLIDATICSDEVPQGRPAPFMIQTLMEQLGVDDASKIVKVGDTEVDVLEGRNAACGLVVSVTTGAYTRYQLETYHPDHIIDSLSELSAYIR